MILRSSVLSRLKGRVQGGALAAAGGAGDQEDAVGLLQDLEHPLPRRAVEAEGVEVEADALLVQQAHDHALAEHGRHGGHAQIQLLALDAQRDAPVLRQPALGDVELGHDLDARDHRGGGAHRRRVDLLEDAVDAVAHLELVGEGLDVHVRGPRLDRALHDLVDQPDHRRLAGQVAQVLDVLLEKLPRSASRSVSALVRLRRS
jgi:hypothetical protein